MDLMCHYPVESRDRLAINDEYIIEMLPFSDRLAIDNVLHPDISRVGLRVFVCPCRDVNPADETLHYMSHHLHRTPQEIRQCMETFVEKPENTVWWLQVSHRYCAYKNIDRGVLLDHILNPYRPFCEMALTLLARAFVMHIGWVMIDHYYTTRRDQNLRGCDVIFIVRGSYRFWDTRINFEISVTYTKKPMLVYGDSDTDEGRPPIPEPLPVFGPFVDFAALPTDSPAFLEWDYISYMNYPQHDITEGTRMHIHDKINIQKYHNKIAKVNVASNFLAMSFGLQLVDSFVLDESIDSVLEDIRKNRMKKAREALKAKKPNITLVNPENVIDVLSNSHHNLSFTVYTAPDPLKVVGQILDVRCPNHEKGKANIEPQATSENTVEEVSEVLEESVDPLCAADISLLPPLKQAEFITESSVSMCAGDDATPDLETDTLESMDFDVTGEALSMDLGHTVEKCPESETPDAKLSSGAQYESGIDHVKNYLEDAIPENIDSKQSDIDITTECATLLDQMTVECDSTTDKELVLEKEEPAPVVTSEDTEKVDTNNSASDVGEKEMEFKKGDVVVTQKQHADMDMEPPVLECEILEPVPGKTGALSHKRLQGHMHAEENSDVSLTDMEPPVLECEILEPVPGKTGALSDKRLEEQMHGKENSDIFVTHMQPPVLDCEILEPVPGKTGVVVNKDLGEKNATSETVDILVTDVKKPAVSCEIVDVVPGEAGAGIGFDSSKCTSICCSRKKGDSAKPSEHITTNPALGKNCGNQLLNPGADMSSTLPYSETSTLMVEESSSDVSYGHEEECNLESSFNSTPPRGRESVSELTESERGKKADEKPSETGDGESINSDSSDGDSSSGEVSDDEDQSVPVEHDIINPSEFSESVNSDDSYSTVSLSDDEEQNLPPAKKIKNDFSSDSDETLADIKRNLAKIPDATPSKGKTVANPRGVFKCSFCDKVYSRKNSLTKHLHTHGDKKYQCDKCPKGFNYPKDLENHKRVHDDTTKFKCTKCEKSYTVEANLKAHMQEHDGTGYTCEICGTTKNKKHLLLQHIRGVHGDGHVAPCEVQLRWSTDKTVHIKACPKCKKIIADRKKDSLEASKKYQDFLLKAKVE